MLPDLIPVVGYIFMKARCRFCKGRISVRYPLVEFLTAVGFVLLFKKYSMTIDFAVYAYLLSILIIAAFIDIDHMIIPDKLVIAGLAGGIAVFFCNLFKTMDMYGDNKWWNPLLGAVSASGILFLVAVIGNLVYKTDEALGLGDIKIFIPIGLFLGWRMSILTLLLSIFTSGVFGMFLIAVGKKRRRDVIPFGPFIVFSTFIVLMWGWDIFKWYIIRG